MTGRGNPEPDFQPVVTPCDQLVAELALVDVVLALVQGVAPGQSLVVALIEDRFPAAFVGAERLGSIAAGGKLGRLVECLRLGQKYIAFVLEVDEALVRVRISPA